MYIVSVRRRWREAEPEGGTDDGTVSGVGCSDPNELRGRTIVVPAPSLDQDLSLGQRVEDLAVVHRLTGELRVLPRHFAAFSRLRHSYDLLKHIEFLTYLGSESGSPT